MHIMRVIVVSVRDALVEAGAKPATATEAAADVGKLGQDVVDLRARTTVYQWAAGILLGIVVVGFTLVLRRLDQLETVVRQLAR